MKLFSHTKKNSDSYRNLQRLIAKMIFLPAIFSAQTFNYNVSADTSQSSYTALTTKTMLNADSGAWKFHYKVPIGFSFSFMGKSFDTLSVETNGYLVFGDDNKRALMAFNNFHYKKDSLNKFSALAYNTSGTAGSKILKIEFKNVGQGSDPKELLSYQVWLRENGNAEVVIGPGTYDTHLGDTLTDTNQVVIIGMLNRNMDGATNGIFLSGSPDAPSSTPVTEQDAEIKYMRTIPREGTRYVFDSNSN